jgi:hypothetical protein
MIGLRIYASSVSLPLASASTVRAYSSSCIIKPQFGAATERLDLTCATASPGLMPQLEMRYAATTDTLRLAPIAQCTKIRVFGLELSACLIKAVVLGRWPASSAKGVSCRGTTIRVREMWAVGMRERGIADRTCVMPCAASNAGSSALDKSET